MSLTSWLRNRPANPAPTAPRPTRTCRPRLEPLDARDLPSSYYAATASDLIADIKAANQAGGANTITLAAGATFDLTAINNATDGANGLPVVGQKSKPDTLTIVGNGAVIQRDAGAGIPAFRLFEVAAGSSLTVQNLTLRNGLASGPGTAADGGAVFSHGTLRLSQVTVAGNQALGRWPSKQDLQAGLTGNAAGGGVWSDGVLAIDQCLVQGNSATGEGPSGNGYGGGVCVAGGTATISNSRVGGDPLSTGGGNSAMGDYNPSWNEYGVSSSAGGFGGGVYVGAGTATLTGDTIADNAAGFLAGGNYFLESYGLGGGLYIAPAAAVSLDTATLYGTSANTDYASGGGGTANIAGPFTLLP